MQKSLISKVLLIIVLCFVSMSITYGQQKFTISSYIEQHKKVAQQLMKETGVPASVILAVAIHESAFGNSRVAKNLNNHFGIKGKNNSTAIRSAYKGYDSVKLSYNDFIDLLRRKKSTQGLFDKYNSTDYNAWVRGISRSGYSATKGWSSKVLSTIDRYNLDEFDAK